MKALSLTQPWATLIALGAKRIETRSWPTNYRGWLAIHAAKGLADLTDPQFMALCLREPFRSALWPWNTLPPPMPSLLPRGAVVAVCQVVACIPTRTALDTLDWSLFPPHEQAFGNYAPGRYAWIFNTIALPTPIPARGALGLWDWDAPPAVLALLSEGAQADAATAQGGGA